MGNPKYLNESLLIFINPGHGGESTNCPVDPLRELFFEDKGDDASEEALYKAENIVDWGAYLSHRFENVAMEDHLPLNATFWRKERAGVDR